MREQSHVDICASGAPAADVVIGTDTLHRLGTDTLHRVGTETLHRLGTETLHRVGTDS